MLSYSVQSDSLATPWTVAHQAPLSMGFSKKEYWSGLPFPPPEDLPNPGIKPMSPALAGGFFTTEPLGKHSNKYVSINNYFKYKWTKFSNQKAQSG